MAVAACCMCVFGGFAAVFGLGPLGFCGRGLPPQTIVHRARAGPAFWFSHNGRCPGATMEWPQSSIRVETANA